MSDLRKIPSRGTELDIDKCVKDIGSRFDLVLIASIRSRELARRDRDKNKDHLSHAVSALLEVQDGKIGRSYLNKIE